MFFYDKVKAKLDAGEILLGTHVFAGVPMLTEAMASVGFDMLWIDMEHDAIDKAAVLNNLIAARAGGTAAVVRIEWNDLVLAKPILDMGPDGIIFPYIRTIEEAKAAISACLYPPKGERGYGPLRALQYGKRTPMQYTHEDYKKLLKMIQIEHIDAVNCLEEMAKIEDIDAFIIGMNDLSGSMGHIGDPLNPEMMPIYQKICDTLRGKKPFGVAMDCNPKMIAWWTQRGAQMIFSGHDVAYVYSGACEVLAKQRKAIEGGKRQ